MPEPQRIDVRLAWSRIRPALAELLEPMGERPEEIYSECRAGRAHCYLADDGFCILADRKNRDFGTPEVFVWVACSFGGQDLLQRFTPWLRQVVRAAGADVAVCRVARPGMQRLLGPAWTPRFTEMEMRVDP